MTRICVNDHQAEAILNFCEVTWIVKKISMEDVDWEASSVNPARLWHHVNADVVAQYVTAMEAGDEFPRVVVEASENGYIIIGGNRRMAAMKHLGDTEIEAYVLKPIPARQREICIRSLNSRHGEGIDKGERMAQAVYLVLSCGLNVKDAARLQSLPHRTVQDHVNAAKVTQRLAATGLDVSKVPLMHLAIIAKISDNKQAARLSKILLEHKASFAETKDIVAAVLASPSVTITNKRINEFESHLATTKGSQVVDSRVIQKPHWRRFTMSLSNLSLFLDRGNDGIGFTSLDELQCSPENAAGVIDRATTVIRRLRLIAGVK